MSRSPCKTVSAFPLMLGLALAGCAGAELATHTAKGPRTPRPAKQVGDYKVGNPYQIAGVWYYPKVDYGYDRTGVASWYGPGFHGKLTANGETYDENAMTAAHPTLPMPSIVRVTNLENGRSVVVRINDRGPFKNGRLIDMSRRGSALLGFQRQGTAKVRVQVLEDESRMHAALARGKAAPADGARGRAHGRGGRGSPGRARRDGRAGWDGRAGAERDRLRRRRGEPCRERCAVAGRQGHALVGGRFPPLRSGRCLSSAR